jgi:hypothetical protein
MQQQSQRTVARVAAVTPQAAKTRTLEATRASAVTMPIERARYVDPALERLLGQVPQNTGSRGHK